jgi:hypothetical protein
MREKTMNVFETQSERYDRWFDRHPAAYASEVVAGYGKGGFAVVAGLKTGKEEKQ